MEGMRGRWGGGGARYGDKTVDGFQKEDNR